MRNKDVYWPVDNRGRRIPGMVVKGRFYPNNEADLRIDPAAHAWTQEKDEFGEFVTRCEKCKRAFIPGQITVRCGDEPIVFKTPKLEETPEEKAWRDFKLKL